MDQEQQRPGILGRIGNAISSPTGTGLLAGLLTLNPAIGAVAGNARRQAQARKQERDERIGAIRSLPGLLGPDPLTRGVDANDQVLPLPPQMQQNRAVDRRENLLSALSVANPGGFTQGVTEGVLGGMFQKPAAPTAMERNLAALGLPMNTDGVQQLAAARQAPATAEDQLRQTLLVLQAQGETNKLATERQEQDQAAVQRRNTITDGLASASRLAGLNERLRGTPLQTGGTFQEVRRAGTSLLADGYRLFGKEDKAAELERGVQDFDSLRKETAVLAGLDLKAMQDAGINVTNGLRNLVQSANASEAVSPGTNDAITKGKLSALIRAGRADGMSEEELAPYAAQLSELQAKEMVFANEVEAEAAIAAGELKVGDFVVIDGQRMRVEPD